MKRFFRSKKLALFVVVLQVTLLLFANIPSLAATAITTATTSNGILLEEFDTLGSWQVVDNCSLALDISEHNSGNASLKMSSSVADGGECNIEGPFASTKDLTNLQNVEINLYINDLSAINTVALFIMTDNGNFYNNYIGDWELMKGWNRIRRTLSDFAKYGNPNLAQINKLWIKIESTPAKIPPVEPVIKPVINIDRISYNVTGQSNILFTFDDASSGVFSSAFPIMKAKEILGTTWACKGLSDVDDPAFMSPDILKTLYSEGWDIGNHTVSHEDDITILTTAKKTSEYKDNITWLNSLGFTRSSPHACFPMGSFNDELLSILPTIGVISARTTIHGLQSSPVEDIYRLKTVAVGQGTDVSYVNSMIDKAVKTGSSIMFMFHDVAPSPSPTDPNASIIISDAKFTEIINYASTLKGAGKITTPTISQWYDWYQNSIPIPTTVFTSTPTSTPIPTPSSSPPPTVSPTLTPSITPSATPSSTHTPTPIANTNDGGGGDNNYYPPTSTPTAIPTATPLPTNYSSGSGGGYVYVVPTPIPTLTPTATPIYSITITEKKEIKEPNRVYPGAGVFTDSVSHWSQPLIMDLFARGIIKGYEDNTIRPSNEVTRAEAAILIARGLKLKPALIDEKTDFADDSDIPYWAKGYIKAISQNGIIQGYNDKTFRPNNKLSRQELIVMVMNGFKFSAQKKDMTFRDTVSIPYWAKASIETATSLNIINGYPNNTFRGANSITRAEIFAVISKSLSQKN